ncbi:hypothetical protein SODG_003209 [Sodalis praecaptivus]
MELAGLAPREYSRGASPLLASRNASSTANNFALNAQDAQTRGALQAGNTDAATSDSRAAPSAMDAQSEGTQQLMDNFLQMMLAQIKTRIPPIPWTTISSPHKWRRCTSHSGWRN